MTGVCLSVCVLGPGLDLTSPTFVRSRASQEAGRDGRLAKKTESGPHLWGQGLCRHDLCRCLQQSNFVQAVSSWTIITMSSIISSVKNVNKQSSGVESEVMSAHTPVFF